MKDYEKAAADLAAMIDAAGLGCLAIAGGEGSSWGDGDPLTFRAWVSLLADNQHGIRVPYVCGSSVPMADEAEPFPGAKTANTVAAHEWREKVRRRYVPSTFDVVSALLSDVAAFGDQPDWLAAAEEFGVEMDAANLRKFRDGFERTRTEVASFLRRAFGDRFDEAVRLAGEL